MRCSVKINVAPHEASAAKYGIINQKANPYNDLRTLSKKAKDFMAKKVPEGWKIDRLGNHITEITERYKNQLEIPVLSVTNSHGFIRSEDYFDRQVFSKNLNNYKIVQLNQFAYNPSRLNVGSLARLQNYKAGLLSPMYVIFTANDSINMDFLEFWLQSTKAKSLIKVSTQGTVRDSVNYSTLASFPILLPPRAEQQKIATILNSVDIAIEKTKKIIEQTKRFKQALMQQLLTKGIPGWHKRFKKSAFGEIPEDWGDIKLKSILREQVRNGFSPICPDKPTGKWVLSLAAVTFQGFNQSAIKPAPLNDKRVDASILISGDLLISRSNTRERVGLSGIYKGFPENCTYPDLLMRIRPNMQTSTPEWIETWLLSSMGRSYFEKQARGTSGSMVKIDRKIVENFPLLLPKINEQEKIIKIIMHLQYRIDCEQKIILTLTSFKSVLLGNLLNGQLRVNTKASFHKHTEFQF